MADTAPEQQHGRRARPGAPGRLLHAWHSGCWMRGLSADAAACCRLEVVATAVELYAQAVSDCGAGWG